MAHAPVSSSSAAIAPLGERRVAALLRAVAHVVWSADARAERFLILDGAELTSESQRSFSRAEGLARVHPDDVAATEAKWAEAVRRGEPYDHVVRVRRDSGGWQIRHSRGVPVRDEAGRVVEWVGVSHDVTDSFRAQETVRESSALFSEVIASLREGVVVCDREYRYRLFNPFMERLTRTPARDALGRVPWDVFPYLGAIGLKERLDAALRGDVVVAFEVETPPVGPEGMTQWVSQAIHPLRDADGRIAGVIGIVHDVTDRKRAEAATKTRDEQFRAFMENSPAVAWMTDADGRFTYVNETYRRTILNPKGDFVGLTVDETSPPELAIGYNALIREVARTGRTTEQYEPGVRADGTPGEFWVSRFPVASSAGTLVGGQAVDVTQRNREAAALRETEARLVAAVRAARVGLWEWDLRTNECRFSTEWKRQLGFEPNELTDEYETWYGRLHPDDRMGATRYIDRFLESPTHPYESEFRLRHKDGSYRHILAQASLIADPTGGSRRMIGSHVDITDRVAFEDALRLRDRAILAVSQGILITDATGADDPILYASPGFERLTGYCAAEVVGRNFQFLLGPKTDADDVAKVRAARRECRACTVELLNYRKDGTPFWNALSLSPVRDETGRLTHYVGVHSDVTARRSLEEQLRQSQKMEAIGQLAGGVAHDFNNLLTVINGYSEIVLERLAPDDPLRGLLAEIARAGDRAGSLTRQLLAFSRRQVLEPRVLTLNAVVTDAENMIRRLLGEDVALTANLAPDLATVKADAGQVEQVLVNLAVNARDAMPGGGRLTVETRNVTLDEAYCEPHADVRPGDYVLLAVSDTGTGMDTATLARVFEPFFTTKPPGKGTGLGLATVHGIVKQSGGHIGVHSEPGRGTSFNVYLPTHGDPAPAPELRPAVRPMPSGHETILLVEDEDAVRALGRHVLQSCGYEVLEAEDGLRAAGLVETHPAAIHLLMTDVVMPNLGGRELAERVRAVRPACKVLFLSGYTEDVVLRHDLVGSAVAFLHKPFSPSQLAQRVRDVLDGHG